MKKWKKVILSLIAASVFIISVTGCSSNKEEEAEEITEEAGEMDTEEALENAEVVNDEISAPVPDADVSQVKIDYKSSEIYTKEDMDACINCIIEEFSTWEGCVLYTINYTDDETSKEGVNYINDLGIDEEYTDCMVFKSDFHSPVNATGEAWEPDYDYKDWEWYLGRTSGGEWELLMWGY